MDTMERFLALLTALTEDVRGASALEEPYSLELTITSSPVWPSMLSTTRSYKLESIDAWDLSSILRSLHASNAPTSLNTSE